MTESRPLSSQPVGKGRGAGRHTLGEDAVVPEKPVEATLGRGSKTCATATVSNIRAGGQDLFLPPLGLPMPGPKALSIAL